jgi:nucleoside-diphosphate-sugar epimerase
MIDYFEEDLNLVLDNTKDFWKEIRNKTFFITGGTGFFGIWLTMSFIFINRKLKLNSKIILLTRNKDKFTNKYKWLDEYSEISFLEGDIINFDFINEDIDYIIHAATEASVKLNIEEPLAMFETVVNGTKRILEFAKLKKVESLLFTSSGAVYGAQPSSIENISEDFFGAPNASDATSVYGEGKRMAEVLCAVYHKQYDLPVKVARCYAFMGPFLALDSHFAAGNFIGNKLKGEDIIIEGDGTPFRSYMYSADLIIWLWTILFKGKNNNPYNVGSNQSISISQLAEFISKENKSNETNVIIKSPFSDKPVLRYVPDTSKALNELNLKVYTDLKTSIRKTIDFNKYIFFNSK